MSFSGTPSSSFSIRPAGPADVGTVLRFVKELAEYEHLSHQVVATEAMLEQALFGPNPCAEILVGSVAGDPVGFALFFPTFSTFLGRPGIYLEDIYVTYAARGKGYGKALLVRVARIAHERECGRLEWSALDWNEPAIRFYKALGATSLPEWLRFRMTGETLEALASQD